MNSFFKDKVFFKSLFILIIPMILQEILNSSVNLVDNFMVGQLEEVAITAVGICNQVFFVFNLILFGVDSGASVFIGQYFGKKDFSGIYKVIGFGLIISLSSALLFSIAIIAMPETLMRLYSKDPLVIAEGMKYLQAIFPAYFVIAFVMIINASLKATKNTIYPMITTFISLVTNVLLNYLFIFKLGYGVKGAAIATLCARLVELTVQILIVYIRKLPILTKISNYFIFDKKFIKSYLSIATPIILNDVVWAIGIAICNMAYKYSGTNAQAAVQITGTIQNLFIVVGVSIGGGCGILLSNSLGESNTEKAIDYSKKCMILTVLLSVVMSICLFIISPYIVNIFKITDVVKGYTIKLLNIVSIGMIFKTFNYTSIVGVLRSGGDTKFALFLDFATVWFIGIPMAFLGSYFLQLPIYITYAMVYSEELVKVFFSLIRVKQRKWVKTFVD